MKGVGKGLAVQRLLVVVLRFQGQTDAYEILKVVCLHYGA